VNFEKRAQELAHVRLLHRRTSESYAATPLARREVYDHMTKLQNLITSVLLSTRNEEGQTMAEYGILVAVIALIAIAGALAFGGALNTFFSGLGSKL
jgi:pilus assembly protein Flp/PilA